MSRSGFFLLVFALMSLQMFFSMFQVKRYKKEMNRMRGTGIVGIGHTKGGMKMGQILLVSYSRRDDRVVACKAMRGMTIFASFKTREDLVGMSLSDLKALALQEDAKEFSHRRKKHPYDADEYSKKKGALIQAVEAIEGRMAMEDNPEQHRVDMHANAMKYARRREQPDA